MALLIDKEMLEMKKYWMGQLVGKIQKSGLPQLEQDIHLNDKKLEKLILSFDQPQVDKINNLTGNSFLLKYVVIVTAIKICLLKYHKNEYITVGSPVRKEDNIDQESNALAIVSRITEQMTAKDLMLSIRKTLVDAYKNQSFPINLLINAIQLEDKSINDSLFDLLIMLTNIHDESPKELDLDLIIQLTSNDNSFYGEITYNSLLFSEQTIDLFKQDMINVLEIILTNPDRPIMQFPEGQLKNSFDLKREVLIEGVKVDLDAIEALLKEHPAIKNAEILLKENPNGEQILTAYVVARPNQIRSNQLLKGFLLKKLPKNMIPSEFVWIDSKDGKIDINLLSESEKENSPTLSYVKPRNEVEKKIADIWCGVLNLKDVGINDNFFEIGGDSILSIQVYYEMKQAGLNVSPKDIISRPTIAEVAQNVGSGSVIKADQGTITGSTPLTAVQHWFFENEFYNVNHYNNSWLLEVHIDLNPNIANTAFDIIAKHHDALRLRFKKEKSTWVQYFSESDENIPFDYYDLSEFNVDNQKLRIEELATFYQTKLDITNGPIIRVVYFNLGNGIPGRLLIVSHRLLTDAMTMRILAEDFQNVYSQLLREAEIQLNDKSTSFQYWSQKLTDYSLEEKLNQELSYWLNEQFFKPYELPVEFKDGDNTEATTEVLFSSLDRQETEYLIRTVPNKLQVGMNEVVFTTLLKTLYQWTGNNSLLVESGGHGREHISDDIDLSRTVGWFTTNFPVFLGLDMEEDIELILQNVKKQLSNIPNNGFGYGALRYLSKNQDLQSKLSTMVIPPIGFDYQGHINNTKIDKEHRVFAPVNESMGNLRDPQNSRIREFDITSWIYDQEYILEWKYSKERFKKSTIEKLMKSYVQNLREIISLCKEK
ncbi:condensation domain-containing protein [Peribacillus frigoritolerans]|uniref:condensation domain-containing protein n=1 Tax=Peribacillus frigoritolerans TaxID=450367 RepID=UPI002EC092EA|nr:condensation domain-containing protein [Peribacillus frigoritolerans]